MQMTTVRDSTGSSGAQCHPTHGSPRGRVMLGVYRSPVCTGVCQLSSREGWDLS